MSFQKSVIRKAYIASSSKFAEACDRLACLLEKNFQITITRRWWVHHVKDSPNFKDMSDSDFYIHPQVQFIRELDFKAIREADLVIVIARYPRPLTGALIEAGYALALGKIVIFYGNMKRSAMVSSCIHVSSRDELYQLLERMV